MKWFRSLSAKILLGNALGLLFVLLAFAWIQILQSDAIATRTIDRILLERSNQPFRRGLGPNGPGFGPPGGQGLGLGGRQNDQNPAPSGGAPPDEGAEPAAPPVSGQEPPPGQLPGQGRGQGQGGPRREPPEAWMRTIRLINKDGKTVWPPESPAPLSVAHIEKTIKGETVFANIVHNGTSHRMISRPHMGPNGEPQVLQIAQENESLSLIRHIHMTGILSILPGIFALSLGIAWLLSKFLLKPIRAMTVHAEQLSRVPDSRERIAVGSDDELGRLAGVINIMTDRLQQAKDEVSATLEQQKRFSSDAAHELRTPLTAISLAAENGTHPTATTEDMSNSLNVIRRLSGSMTKLTEMLLTLARLDRVNAQLELTRFDWEATILDALKLSGLESDSRIQIEIEATHAVANRDATLQILRNLLDNAAAYGAVDRPIRIIAREDGFGVHNFGPAIPPEHVEHLFERFYRVDPSRTRSSGGHGLGLSIVQSLAQAMGATVKVTSSEIDGTTFFVNFSEKPISSQESNVSSES